MEMVSGRRDVKPLLLKFGLALALSVAGYFVAHLRSRHRPSPSSSSSALKPVPGSEPTTNVELKDELRILRRDEGLSKFVNGTSTTTTTTKTVVGDSLTIRNTGDDEGLLLPEFNKHVFKNFELSVKDPESATSTPTRRRSNTREDNSSMEQDISYLKNLVFSLREGERNLELQLVEYYGMQEREAALRELESQLKTNNMEAKLFGINIETLQSENQSLQALVLIGAFQGWEQKHGRDALEMERKLNRLKELEEENGSLGTMNSSLVQENLELKNKLDSAQKIGNSVIEYRKAEEIEEVQNLKQSNDHLLKENEKLQINHCSDVEELVYLRWANTCLRHELRNYQPPQEKTVARDLSKCLSPRYEENAKQLFLEYSNSRFDEKSVVSGDTDGYSSSHASTGESDDVFMEISSNLKHSSKKSKFFSKLKKLVHRKEHHCNRVSKVDRTPPSCDNSHRRVSF